MLKLNISEAKTHLSKHLRYLEDGGTIILCRRNVPIAEIRPLRQPPETPRQRGTLAGFTVPDSFFAPLPDDLLDAFEGDSA